MENEPSQCCVHLAPLIILTNPRKVDFDSVFNRSSHTYSFGSPDILPMFAKGATEGKVDMWSYREDAEDFTSGITRKNAWFKPKLKVFSPTDATALDTWVLDQLQTLFRNASTNPSLDAQMREEKTVFFLHLLGLDTTGHSYRPFSKVRDSSDLKE